MTPTIIILLLVLGLILIALEIFLVPGTTVVGMAGGALMVAAIICSFIYLETTYAWAIFSGSTVFSIILGYFAFRPSTWKKIAVNSTIDGKIIENTDGLHAGSQGVTLTPCNPIGKAKFGDKMEEVYSLIDFIDADTNIKIDSIKENKIFVTVVK